MFDMMERIIYMKAGPHDPRTGRPYELSGHYLRRRPDGLHEIKLDDYARVRRVKFASIRRASTSSTERT